MATARAKSRKRRAVDSSDRTSDEERKTKASKTTKQSLKSTNGTRVVSKPSTKTTKHAARGTPSPSKRKEKIQPSPNKSLHSFFNTTSHQEYLSASQETFLTNEDQNDLIIDDSSDGGLSKLNRKDSTNSKADSQSASQSLSRPTKPVQASHHLSKSSRIVPKPARLKNKRPLGDQRPWSERYGPLDLSEIAVHKKKVTDVGDWIKRVHEGRTPKRLLILRGPAGCGKSITVALLSKEFGFSVLEWRNPTAVDFGDGSSGSASAQFQDFVTRAGKQGSLDTFKDSNRGQESHLKDDKAKKILLVEEFPSVVTRSSTALQSFRSTLLEFLSRGTHGAAGFQMEKVSNVPLILVISETLLTTTTASADSFTAHRLLGHDVLNHPATVSIEFNPIAPTFMAKALDLIIRKESRVSGRRYYPGTAVLKSLATIGDIRNAVGSLEFLCARGDSENDWSGRAVLGKAKGGSKKQSSPTAMEKESLELVTQREASLGIFHAVGKVVYNKREGDSENLAPIERLVQPPDHLSHYFRTRPSLVSPEQLIDETGTDTATFIAALHENYVLSCEHGMTEDTLESVAGCIETLSDGDLLQSSWRNPYSLRRSAQGSNFQGTTLDAMRQDEISFHAVTRGLLFHLPHPVKRQISSSGRGSAGRGDAFKMFYPASMRLWRQIEECQESVTSWASQMRGSSEKDTKRGQDHEAGAVASWRSRQSISSRDSNESESNTTRPVQEGEMILLQLPYYYEILRARKNTMPALLRTLQKTVKLQGFEQPDDDLPDGGDEYSLQADWSTDRPLDEIDAAKQNLDVKRGKVVVKQETVSKSSIGNLERLVLSEDDIED